MTTGSLENLAVDPQLLTAILSPYKPHCRYLREVYVEIPQEGAADPQFLARATGEFAILESCYIDDTGHLNSVEVNICYNQIMYVLFARCVEGRILPALRHMTLDDYKQRQLPGVLIHGYTSTFKRPIGASSFNGEMGVTSAVHKSQFILFKTFFRFWDDRGGHAEGDVSLALIESAREANAP
jgi:hypothetical protein